MFLWQSVSVDQCDHGCSFRRQRCHPIHQFTESCIDFLDKASAFGSLSLSAQYSNISNIRMGGHKLTMVNGQRYCRTQIHTEEPRPALIASAKGRHQRWKKRQTLQTRPCYFSHFNDDHEVLSIILNKEQTRISGNVVVAINVFQLKSGSVTEPALLELQVKLKKQITPISSFLLYYLMFSVFKYVNTGSRCDPPRPVLSYLVNVHVLMLMPRSLPLS